MKTSSTINFTLYPLAWLAVSFAIGIFANNYFNFGWQIYLIISIISAFSAIIFRQSIFLLIAFFALGGLCFQVEKLSVSANRVKVLFDSGVLKSGEPFEIEGILQGKPELAVGGFFLWLKTEKAIYKGETKEISGNVRLFAPIPDENIQAEYDNFSLGYGSRVRVACMLKREEKFQNPGVKSFKEILDQKDLDATAIIKSPLLIEKIEDTATFAPMAWLYERRQDLILQFKKYFSVPTAGVLIASLLGNRYHLDKPTSERFREGGTIHVIVISGLQITFIGTWTLLLLRRFTKNRWWQFLLATAFLWSYSLAVGAEVPVTRAAIMFTILLFADVIFRTGTLLNALGASSFLLLIWKPSDIFDQSFQLTFACVIAIVAMAFPLLEKMKSIGAWRPTAETPIPPKCSKWLKTLSETLYWSEVNWQRELKRNIWTAKILKTKHAEKLEQKGLQKLFRYIFETLLVSAIVQIWLIPLLVVYFHRVSLVSLILNVWAGALTAIGGILAIISIALAQISETFALPFIKLTELLHWIIIHAGDIFIFFNISSVRIPHYAESGQIVYFLYFIPILYLSYLANRWNPFRLISDSKFQIPNWIQITSLIILFAIIIFHPNSSPNPDGRLHVDFLDVGQGDSALLTMPTGETLLVDGGGKINFSNTYVKHEGEEPELFEPDVANIGEAVVSEYLWEKGCDSVDYILATHADADHIQGLADVAKNFKIKSAIFGRTSLQDADFAEVYDVLQKNNVPITKVSQGDILTFGDVKIEVLYPIKDDSPEAISDNNHSVVLRVIYGEKKILLTGDIEKETEAELLKTSDFLRCDIIKTAHHGSRTSSTEDFVNATNAKVAVISVGKDSPFNHPHEEVVERWKESKANVLTTGENGTISLETDGKDLQLKTYLQTQKR
jgi:competence protein ComEC